jgi:hypothetical protein
MIVLSLALVVGAVLKRRVASAPVNRADLGRAFLCWGAFVACIALMKVVGFIVAYAILTWFIVAVMARRPSAWRCRSRSGARHCSTRCSPGRSTFRCRRASSSSAMEIFAGLMQGFQVALTPANLMMCVVGVVLGTVIGVMPGLGALRHHRDAAAAHLQARPHRRHDHAGRHLLRRQVRRLDHLDPAQRSRRVGLGGHLPRRLRDGAQGAAGRASAWRRSPRSSRAPSASWR